MNAGRRQWLSELVRTNVRRCRIRRGGDNLLPFPQVGRHQIDELGCDVDDLMRGVATCTKLIEKGTREDLGAFSISAHGLRTSGPSNDTARKVQQTCQWFDSMNNLNLFIYLAMFSTFAALLRCVRRFAAQTNVGSRTELPRGA